ncbi:alkaline phosphatase D family protein [Colwellia sp. 12G3]|uniref:alkaline phosphatase D family protein n=1 Tax=Colwellia sp. 12G3 TaxID=2058299 RepID=UPI000C320CDD|nr:alkaline phosphatase D family protein [Colwellia sp. 12G3]PKI16256.1 metallophosphatase [Colwellia sp. 12G3]
MKHSINSLIITATLSLSITAQATSLSQLDITPHKILFGSCSNQDKDMPILKSINNEAADLFIFLGDNIYGDTENMQDMANKYQRLGDNPDIQALRLSTAAIAIWDDHDFGENDAGKEYAQKEQSRKLMLDFWQEPKNSPRYTQQHGIYTAYLYGESNNSVHVILPDLRWNRDALTTVGKYDYQTKRKAKNMGPYSPNLAKNASMLGETQWQWLEIELQKPSKIKIIASSLQLLPEFTGWESWANFPHDRERLFALIKKYQVNGVIIISGDTHWGEMSKVTTDLDYPLWEVTSSGLTEEWKEVSPNIHRVGDFISKVNYGELLIDWQQVDPKITLSLKEVDGKVFNRQVISLSSISPYDKG